MTEHKKLETALGHPKESLSFEYKAWLDLGKDEHKATLAKAVIAMANAKDGGYVVIGFADNDGTPQSVPPPEDMRQFTQDLVNDAIKKYMDPEVHLRLEMITHADTGVDHPVIVVPATAQTPVMAKRDYVNVLRQYAVYVRKPGPRSEVPQTVGEWRELLHHYVLRERESMLDAIRRIVDGGVEDNKTAPDLQARLANFVAASHARHEGLLDDAGLPPDAGARMPLGFYEIGFAFDDAQPAPDLANLKERIEKAHRISLTGWPPFLVMTTVGKAPYPHDGGLEAWIGRFDKKKGEAAYSDFWRIVPEGMLYTRRGYKEDDLVDRVKPGSVFDYRVPIWRVAEALLFARRLAATYEGVERMAVWVRWSGLKGRELVISASGGNLPVRTDHICRTSAIESTRTMTFKQIDDNLPEVVHALLVPLFEAFDFYKIDRQIVNQNLEELKEPRWLV